MTMPRERAQIKVKLEVGQIDQSLMVSTASIIDTSSAAVGQVLDTETVDRMPLNGRSFWQLTSLTPGATYNPGGRTDDTHRWQYGVGRAWRYLFRRKHWDCIEVIEVLHARKDLMANRSVRKNCYSATTRARNRRTSATE